MVEFHFFLLNSGFQSLSIAGFRIPKPKILDLFQKREIRGFWNPDSLTWGEIEVIINNTMTNKTIQLRNNICFLTDNNVI